MEKKKISLIGSLATLFFLLASHICLGGDYEIINDNFPIATTSRHEMIPDSAYNPVNNDFMILWNFLDILNKAFRDAFFESATSKFYYNDHFELHRVYRRSRNSSCLVDTKYYI